MKHDIDWSKSHNGVMLCDFQKTVELMPEVEPILLELCDSNMLEMYPRNYLVDVKVHMLMPKQWPCIPNWHKDFIPRDENMERQFDKITGEKMYMWISGEPLTEYKDAKGGIYTKPAQQWSSFTQHDTHRGTMAKTHTWRCFIRVIPKSLVPVAQTNDNQIRRHSQVYLDNGKFTW